MHVERTVLQVVLCATVVKWLELLTLQSSQVRYMCSSGLCFSLNSKLLASKCKYNMQSGRGVC